MGIRSTLGTAFATIVVIGGLYVGFGDSEDEREQRLQEVGERSEAGGRGAVRTGSGIIKGVSQEVAAILEENGIDVSDYDSLDELKEALEDKGIDVDTLIGNCDGDNAFMDPDCFGRIPGHD